MKQILHTNYKTIIHSCRGVCHTPLKTVTTFILLIILAHFSNAQERLINAYLPVISDTRIVPQPQEEIALPEGYTLTEFTIIYLLNDIPALRLAAEALQDDIQLRYGFRLPVQVGISSQGIVIGIENPTTLAPEGYTLEALPSGITITGADEYGAFYGIQSLRQLLGETPNVRGVRIHDYPDHSWRMAMIYLDNNMDLNQKLIPILAQYKFNKVLVMSDYIQWDSAPNIHVAESASKEQALELVNLARQYLIEPIPLLETLGHSGWLFANDQNKDLLQDPNVPNPWVYDPLNPRTYQVLFPILDELIEIFQPSYIHLGHDEVRNVHPFPSSAAGLQFGFGQLFLQDVQTLHGYLKTKNIRTLLWQDELLSAEVKPLLDQFPKDIMVTSWNYYPAADYQDITTLQQTGFETIGSSWHTSDNIRAYARDAKEKQTLGMLLTRWTGYFGNAGVLHGQYHQIYAALVAAHYFWNPEAEALEDAAIRFRMHYLGNDDLRQHAGTLIDLSSYGNVDLQQGFVNLDDGYKLEGILDSLRFSGVMFKLNRAVALKGSHPRTQSYPESVTISLNQMAGSLAFLHTTPWSTSTGSEIGRYVIHYQDGSLQTVPIIYGDNIATWTETEVTSINLLQGWSGTTDNGLPVAINTLFWTNPEPSKVISHIEFVSYENLASPVLLGLTALE